MDSSMIGKIVKAKQYAEEQDRIKFTALTATVRGKHSTHVVTYTEQGWGCTCNFFRHRGVCSHTMALERILEGMVASTDVGSDNGGSGN